MTKEQFEQLKNAVVVDVRTPAEFASGNVKDSINIPLREIPDRVAEFRNYKNHILLCCASGIRSEEATVFLNSCGLTHVFNGGSYHAVNLLKSA